MKIEFENKIYEFQDGMTDDEIGELFLLLESLQKGNLNVTQFREKYPAYNELSDAKLITSLRDKFYPDLSSADIATKLGVSQPVFIFESGVEFIKDNPEFDAVVVVSILTIVLIFFLRKKIVLFFKFVFSIIKSTFLSIVEKIKMLNVQTIILLVLCFIAFELFKIEQKLTAIPTQNDYLALATISNPKEKSEKKKNMANSVPFVHVEGGDISVSGSVYVEGGNVDVSGSVDVGNTVDVEINR